MRDPEKRDRYFGNRQGGVTGRELIPILYEDATNTPFGLGFDKLSPNGV